MLPNFINTLAWWQWTLLAAVPPAVVLLYFLKLKRYPIEVPSTYLWHRSIEDLHVNTIWQRLRRNLLLMLQLLFLLLIMLALLRPGWAGGRLIGDRFIFLIDNSASMQATDVGESRLDEAKRQAKAAVELMKKDDVAMVVSFADAARVEQMFTGNRRQLLRNIDKIEPTIRSTSLIEALKVASGLANPGRSSDPNNSQDDQVAAAMPATMYVLSDGNFSVVEGFSPGNLDPVYKPVGTDDAQNVGIVNFNVRRNEAKPDQLQAFARLENFGKATAPISLELLLDGQLIDAGEYSVAPGKAQVFNRDLGSIDSGVLELRITTEDDLALDDTAWTVINPPRKANVLLVTTDNPYLVYALENESTSQVAEVKVVGPSVLSDTEGPYYQDAALGAYDLVIFDRCVPKVMPQANTLFVGALPLSPNQTEEADEGEPTAEDRLGVWQAEPQRTAPRVIDVDPTHPLTQWLDMGDVLIVQGTPLTPPPGGSVLVDTQVGPMLAIAPREGFEDAVLGFSFIDEVTDDDGTIERYAGTNWPRKASYPVFILNMLHYLGGGRSDARNLAVKPGASITLESPIPEKQLEVRSPDGTTSKLPPGVLGKSPFSATDQLGQYEVTLDDLPLRQFAVNMYDPSESQIAVKQEIGLGHERIQAKQGHWESARRETWKLLLLVAILLLLVEWYIYSRRVHV